MGALGRWGWRAAHPALLNSPFSLNESTRSMHVMSGTSSPRASHLESAGSLPLCKSQDACGASWTPTAPEASDRPRWNWLPGQPPRACSSFGMARWEAVCSGTPGQANPLSCARLSSCRPRESVTLWGGRGALETYVRFLWSPQLQCETLQPPRQKRHAGHVPKAGPYTLLSRRSAEPVPSRKLVWPNKHQCEQLEGSMGWLSAAGDLFVGVKPLAPSGQVPDHGDHFCQDSLRNRAHVSSLRAARVPWTRPCTRQSPLPDSLQVE